MKKISESYKSYLLRKKAEEENKLIARLTKEAKEALTTPEIFVSDRSVDAADFHASRRSK